MKLRASAFFGMTLYSLSALQQAAAGDMYLSLFFSAAPVSGADIRLNGEKIGSTDDLGNLEYTIEGGDYSVVIGPKSQEIASFEFSVEDDKQNIDIKVDASGEEAAAVNFDKYYSGDVGGPTGVIRGYVNDWFRSPIYDATVVIEELGLSTQTDTSGYFELTVPRGNRYIQVSHPTAGAPADAEVRVVADAGVELTIKMLPKVAQESNGQIEETIVTAKAYNSNPVDTVALEYESMTVTDALDFIQIQRYGDSNVAAAVKRVVGVTVRDGKYAIIRGLEGRYVGTTLNGSLMPSTDPQKRDAELDLFPSDILQNLEVQKGFTADQMGDSSAGALKINTKTIPDERIFKLSVSAKHRSGVTGKDILDYEGSETDGLGFDDGFRDLPNPIRVAADQAAGGTNLNFSDAELIAMGQSLTNVYNTRNETADVAYDVSAVYGDVFDLEDSTLGFYAAASYGTDIETRQDYLRQDGIGNVAEVRTQSRTDRLYDFNAYFAAGWNKDSLELASKTIFIRQTQDLISNSLTVDRGDDDREFDDTVLEWTEREFVSQQFEGKHFIADAHTLNWSVTAAQTDRYQPDRREYQYDDGLLIAGLLERRWSELTDDALNLRLDYEGSFDISDTVFTTVKVGAMKNTIDREVDVIRIGFDINDEPALLANWNVPAFRGLDLETMLIGDNLEVVGGNGGLALEIDLDGTEDTASYDSEADVDTLYISTETEFGETLSLILGVRQEDYTQSIEFPNSNALVPDLESDELLTSFALNFKPNDSWVFRLGYSNTVSYPGLTERSPSLTFDNQTQDPIFGNPNLKVATIDNIDARAEFYFNEALSSISLAAFHKVIDDPIERARNPGSGGVRDSITFRNALEAEVSGIEIDANVQLFNGDNFEGFIAGNLAFTESEITLDALSLQLEADPNRELQGLSPIIANIQFGVDHLDTAQNLTVVLNYFDDRIDSTVTSSINKAIVEKGRINLGVNYSKEFDYGGKVSLKLSNLTDAEVRYEGESILGQVNYIESYKKGRTISLGYSQSF